MDKKQSFITAIKNNESLIYKIASVYTNNSEDKNDLVQEIVYQLWKSYDTFNYKSGITTWMYRVAMNVAIYNLKIAKKNISTVPIEEQVFDFHEINNDEIEDKWQMLKSHLNKLSLLDKGIVMLYLDNKSYDEIAQIIGISTSNVGTKLNRIKEKLKSSIAKIK